jgi:hypothetical protein
MLYPMPHLVARTLMTASNAVGRVSTRVTSAVNLGPSRCRLKPARVTVQVQVQVQAQQRESESGSLGKVTPRLRRTEVRSILLRTGVITRQVDACVCV